ncbi:uncharacterized protein Dsk [Ochlerotatus camptorhynchus]|uniref:uncharacterized protein Dsk n=1 Tax=Ochlerotatus camptorhynchus TaxID=644619 RepID=UPI0031D07625
MARLTLSILTTLIIYFAYQALVSEAISTSDSSSSSNNRGSQSTRSSETVENLLSQDDGLSKLQTAWLKNALNRRSFGTPAAVGQIGTYTVLRRSPSVGAGSYLADLNFVDDEDVEKRFDDYGHMRFGKRGGGGDQFDDYGHMRFGRR